jgi:hypothetical protein
MRRRQIFAAQRMLATPRVSTPAGSSDDDGTQAAEQASLRATGAAAMVADAARDAGAALLEWPFGTRTVAAPASRAVPR